MKPKLEKIALPLGRSFRLLQWKGTLHNAELVGAGGDTQPLGGADSDWHFHPEFELTLITRGSGTRFIGDEIATFRSPDLILIGSGLPHYWHGLENSDGYAVQFCLDATHPLRLLDETRELRTLFASAQYGIRFTGDTRQRVKDLIVAMPGRSGVARFALFMLILDALLAAPQGERRRLSRKALTSSKQRADSLGVQRAMAFIMDNFREPLPLDALLLHASMSKATFSRHFRKHTGKTFTEFLNEVRIDFACRRLVETNQSISEIAFAAGFNSLSHFNYGFQTVHHCTPSAFRRTRSR